MVKNYRPGGIGMIPAEKGTYLVHAYFDDHQVELVKSNVLGWQVGSERILTPLVVDPSAITNDDWFVIHPDGRVECSDGRCWETVDDWTVEERRLLRDSSRPAPVVDPKPEPKAEVKSQAAEAS